MQSKRTMQSKIARPTMGSGTYSKARINAQTKGLRAYYSRLSRQRDGLTGEERDKEYRKEKAGGLMKEFS